MEYCAGGDLAAYLKKRRILPERLAISITKQLGKTLKSSYANFLACALEMLRMKNIVHRDLKPHNLLLSGNIDSPQIKVADFGFARAILPTDMAETLCGSPLYMVCSRPDRFIQFVYY